jgi:ABC-type lipoprotein release transport system permease subunit
MRAVWVVLVAGFRRQWRSWLLLAALAHLLVVSVARRRTESGLLRALGMVRRQLAAIVFWQATTVAVVAVAAGIPLGIAAGRAI